MKRLTSLYATAFTTLIGLGCGGDAVESMGLQVRAASSTAAPSNADLIMLDSADTAFNLSVATLNLRDIKLDLPEGIVCADVEADLENASCSSDSGDEDTIEIEGPFLVDLVAGTSTPTLDDVVIPALSYRRIDFRVDDVNDESFAVIADFDLDGSAMTLDLSLDFNEDIRIEQAGGIDVTADSDLVAEFVVNDWLAGVDIGACIDDGDVAVDGTTVTVSEDSTSGSCSDIENTIKDNMKNSGQFDRD